MHEQAEQDDVTEALTILDAIYTSDAVMRERISFIRSQLVSLDKKCGIQAEIVPELRKELAAQRNEIEHLRAEADSQHHGREQAVRRANRADIRAEAFRELTTYLITHINERNS